MGTGPLTAFSGAVRVTIAGAGRAATIIKYQGRGATLDFTGASHILVRDLTLSGLDPASQPGQRPIPAGEYGIRFNGYAEWNTIESCAIENFEKSAVRFDNPGPTASSGNAIRHSLFLGNGEAQLYASQFADFRINGNEFGISGSYRRVGSVGAELNVAGAGTYSENYHWGNDVALKLIGSFNRIENNRFEQSYKEGIVLEGPATGWPYSQLNIITGNTIHTNSSEQSGAYAAVRARYVSSTVFTSNQIFSWDSVNVSTRPPSGSKRTATTGSSATI